MSITKRVIVLEQTGSAPMTFRFAMWADVPAARQPFYARQQASMVSAWKDASVADTAALQTGAVTERVDSTTMAAGDTVAIVESRLAAIWSAFQAEINAANPWAHYGSVMDNNNVWTLAAVA